MGNKFLVTISSVFVYTVYSTLMIDGLMILVERDTESDGHGLRGTLPYELPRNVQKVRWTSVVLNPRGS